MNAQMSGLASWVTGSRFSAARLTPDLTTFLNCCADASEPWGARLPNAMPTAISRAGAARMALMVPTCLMICFADALGPWGAQLPNARPTATPRARPARVALVNHISLKSVCRAFGTGRGGSRYPLLALISALLPPRLLPVVLLSRRGD